MTASLLVKENVIKRLNFTEIRTRGKTMIKMQMEIHQAHNVHHPNCERGEAHAKKE